MPTERIAMCRVREILRLTLDAGLPVAETARRMGLARSYLAPAPHLFLFSASRDDDAVK